MLVGITNSGKSSILQAIQFAISVAQTTSTIEYASWYRRGPKADRLEISISPPQLIYSPLRDVYALALNGKLQESENSAIGVGFEEIASQNKSEIIVKKGRNKNISIIITGNELGKNFSG